MKYNIAPTHIGILMFAALCHASWNGIVKSVDNSDKMIVSVLINSGVPALFFIIAPLLLPDGFISLFNSYDIILIAFLSALVHSVYWILLPEMYKIMDMSQAYPIARGVSPILVALVAFYVVDDELPFWGIVGVALASLGVLLNAFPKRGQPFYFRAILPALFVGVLITTYTVIDGYGVRLTEEPLRFFALYGFWKVIFATIILILQKNKVKLTFKNNYKMITIGAVLNGMAYGLVLWMLIIIPFAYVSALREISSIFAVLIGILVFKERAGFKRVVFATITIIGCVIIAVGG